MPYLTLKELSEKTGITVPGLFKLVKKAKIPATLWKGNIFFNEFETRYIMRYAKRRKHKNKEKGGKSDKRK